MIIPDEDVLLCAVVERWGGMTAWKFTFQRSGCHCNEFHCHKTRKLLSEGILMVALTLRHHGLWVISRERKPGQGSLDNLLQSLTAYTISLFIIIALFVPQPFLLFLFANSTSLYMRFKLIFTPFASFKCVVIWKLIPPPPFCS